MPLRIRKCFEHRRIWWNDESFGSKFNGSLWEPQLDTGEFFFYHIAEEGHEPQKRFTLVGWGGLEDAFAKPVGFKLVWDDQGASTKKIFSSKSPIRRSLWQPAAPNGYACLGMLGLGADWHEVNPGVEPTAIDFPRYRCIKLDYLEKVKKSLTWYEWRWNNIGSSAKKKLSLFNVVFKQPGLNENVNIGVGVPKLGHTMIIERDVFSFKPDLVTFDEKSNIEETPQEKLIKVLGKAKPVYIGDFYHCQCHSWRYHHFILFSDRRLEYYKAGQSSVSLPLEPLNLRCKSLILRRCVQDSSDENMSKTKYDTQTSLELRGSYDLSAISALETMVDSKRESKYLQPKKNLHLSNSNSPILGAQSGPRNSTSFQALKSLLGFEQEPTPYIIGLQMVNEKPVKFAFESEGLMKIWYEQLKLFSTFAREDPFASRRGILSVHQNSHVQLPAYIFKASYEEENKSVTPLIEDSLLHHEYFNIPEKSSLSSAVKSTFWTTVIVTGMTFKVMLNTGVERCWNIYAGKDKDQITKREIATLLTDYMETKLDVFPTTVVRMQGYDFLDNVGERALQAKKFLNTRRTGRVIFQEFKRIERPEFWKLMDEKKPVTKLNEAREMWKRILVLLADYGLLGDDEVFELWERYDSTETGMLTFNDVQEFLRDWIRAIAKLYPSAVGRRTLQHFLSTLESRAILATRFLDRKSEGLSFKRFRKIQEAAFWRHIDQMVNFEIESPSLSHEQADTINFSISRSMSKPSFSKMFSWSSLRGSQLIRGDFSLELNFPTSEITEASESLYFNFGEVEAQLSDADLPEDPLLNIKLNNCKISPFACLADS